MLPNFTDPLGRLRVAATSPAGKNRIGGVPVTDSNQVIISTNSAQAYVNGYGVMSNGALCTSNFGADHWMGGLPICFNDAINVNPVGTPISELDSFVSGIRVGSNAVYITDVPEPPTPTKEFNLKQFPLDPSITFTRSTPAWYWDQNGDLVQAAINEPRPYRNPGNSAIQGLWIEEATTNSIGNNTMQGAVVGGALPTGWLVGYNSSTGITHSVVGKGVENGIEYIDLRFQGTVVGQGSAQINFINNLANYPSSVVGDVWSESIFLSMLSANQNIQGRFWAVEWDAANAYIVNTPLTPYFDVLSGKLRNNRVAGSAALAGAAVAKTSPILTFTLNNGAVLDFTIRIGLPQFEKAWNVSSPIKTVNAVATRAQDGAKAADISWFNAVEGTFLFEGGMKFTLNQGNFPRLFSMDDGAPNGNSLYASCNVATAQASWGIYSGSVFQGITGANTTASYAGTLLPLKTSCGYKVNDCVVSFDGSVPGVDAVVALPVGMTSMGLGQTATGAGVMNGYISSLKYWNTRLTDGQVQELSLQ
jgi:hypothetical protein